MKKIFCFYCTLIIAVISLYGCKKAVITPGTTADASVYFIYSTRYSTADSLSFSFAAMDTAIKSDTVWLPVRIAGSPADHDRTISLGPDPATTTAIAGKHYQVLPAVMPKDSFSTQVGVVLYRTPDLQDTMVVLGLQLQPNSNFSVLMKDTTMADGVNASVSEFRITLTDELVMPSDWPDFLVYFFGTYSKVKYQFIINATGVAQFPEDMSFGLLLYYLQEAQTALQQYNQTYGTLYDENGNPVTIP